MPPVAPAVVLPQNEGEEEDSKPRFVPVATFVSNHLSNLVRTGIDSITTAYAERLDEQHATTPATSVRSDDISSFAAAAASVPEANALRELQSQRDASDLDDVEYVLVNGDLLEVPRHQEEEEYMDDDAFRSRRANRRSRVRKGMKKIGKWIKRRTRKTGTEDPNNAASSSAAANNSQSGSAATSENSTTKKKVKRRRSWSRTTSWNEEENEETQEVVPVPVAPMEPITECDTQGSSATVNADFIGNADMLPQQQQVAAAAAYIDSSNQDVAAAYAQGFADEQVAAAYAQGYMNHEVSADFIGHADQVLEAGVLANVASADAYIEHDTKAEDLLYKDEKTKADEHNLESMLQQARSEAVDDVEQSSSDIKPHAKLDSKTDAEAPCPLSEAKTIDKHVYNDTLKVVMVGSTDDKSALARAVSGKKPKRPKNTLGVDVHTWTPDLKFSIWDVSSANAGAHPATQSLFFSSNSLFVLIWDLAANNVFFQRGRSFTEEDDDDEENEFLMEENHRHADRALELDINDRVLSWLDSIATPGSSILPVVTVPEIMDDTEVRRRSSMLQALLMQHPVFEERPGAPKLIVGKDSILRVNMDTGEGVADLQEMIHAIASENVFDHVKSPVDPGTVEILETVRRLKKEHKVILVDHLLSEMKEGRSVEDVKRCLHFLSDVGELLYFGNSTDEILSRYIILSRKWLVSALSCILRPDLQRELGETRRFINLQCVYSGQQYSECDVVQTLLQGTHSSCPILSAKDSAMLWNSMSFMREAADRTVQFSVASSTMYDFLERLLVHSGIFLPLTVAREPTYFVPSLLAPAEPSDVWTYKTSDSWMTTLCHSWLLRDGVPSNVMEHVTTSLLQDLYEFSNNFQAPAAKSLHHSKSFPLSPGAVSEFLETHETQAIGRVKIHQVMCWKSSVLVKIGTAFGDHTDLRESFAEIFVALVDDQSELCVAANTMRNGMKRLIVCGKGQVGHHGRKLWKGGYGLVVDSIKASLADFSGVDRQVVCPECLAHSHPSVACTWNWDSVRASAQACTSGLRCTRGHSVDTNLLCGTCVLAPKPAPAAAPCSAVIKPVSSLLNSVVLVGLWDARAQQIRSVGSGFVADKKLGLVVTAGHILFDMTEGRRFGTPYFGLSNARVVIGVMAEEGGHTAVFRYFAEIVSHDIHSVDACVLRITTRLESDVGGDGEGCGEIPEIPLSSVKGENFPQLKMTSRFELEEAVRIMGFNQGGEGVFEKGKHVNRSADFAKGYVCKKFRMCDDGDSESSRSSKSSKSSSSCFSPREEIVVMCPTISGHSGGPCVNDDGKVLGILSRADPVDRQRCYLVPSSELRRLVQQAKSPKTPMQLYK